MAAAVTAGAQLRMPMQLPENDFVWVWGRQGGSESRRGMSDFTVYGNEGGFRCELTARLSIASGLSRTQTRDIESQLRSSLFFVQDTAYAMNDLDAYRYLDWAVLDCKKPEADETESELAEREAKALERAQRRRERRRERDE